MGTAKGALGSLKRKHPDKFLPLEAVFRRIHAGDRIFVSTACGEPQHLVRELVKFVESRPKAFFDAEVMQVWTLGVAPYTDQKFEKNFRHNSFFVGDNTREAVNSGMADYTPIFLSEVPGLFRRGEVPVDVALIQVSPPDAKGRMSLGISVDITKAAVEAAGMVIAQVNSRMPRVRGDSFVSPKDVDFIVPHDEPLLEYSSTISDEIAGEIGHYVARIIEDGDTIQVGYGSIPNAILSNLKEKKDLGVHTELFTNGIAELMRQGVVTNQKKSVDRGKTVATFCMARKETYDYLHDNPKIVFRPTDYTNDPRIIAQNERMVAINSGLEIDLTGQASAESIGSTFYSGIGGQADFMRGAVLSAKGKTILTMQSTAAGGRKSRIVASMTKGAGVTLNRGDVHYVVTEYGIAYLHGKNIRERAMDLIAIAHPKFRPRLIQQAKALGLVYPDQAFIPGKRGEYPRALEMYRTTEHGVRVLLRPVKISDEPMLKDFFYSLSDDSMYKRFISARKDMPHERLQEFAVIDYTQEMVIVAVVGEGADEEIVGVGQYGIDEKRHTAEVALVVRDDMHNKGIGKELLTYLAYLAKKQGLLGFTAEVLTGNKPMLHLFSEMGFDVQKTRSEGVYGMRLMFRDEGT